MDVSGCPEIPLLEEKNKKSSLKCQNLDSFGHKGKVRNSRKLLESRSCYCHYHLHICNSSLIYFRFLQALSKTKLWMKTCHALLIHLVK